MFPGSWSTTGYELAVPKPLPKWAVMTLGSAVLGDKQLAAFKKAFKEAGLEYEDSFCNGIRPVVTKPSDDASLGKMFGRLEEAGIRLLLVILPSQDKALYARLKTWADLTYGTSLCAWNSLLGLLPSDMHQVFIQSACNTLESRTNRQRPISTRMLH